MDDDRHVRQARSSRPWERMRDRVLRQSTICHLCGQPGADTADHLVPVSHGGRTVIDNLAPAHQACNMKRGTRSIDEARQRIAAAGGPAPPGGWWHPAGQRDCCPHSEPWTDDLERRH